MMGWGSISRIAEVSGFFIYYPAKLSIVTVAVRGVCPAGHLLVSLDTIRPVHRAEPDPLDQIQSSFGLSRPV